MWLFTAAGSLFVAAPVALTATWQVPRGTKISQNISLKSIFRLFRKIYSSERKIVTLLSPLPDPAQARQSMQAPAKAMLIILLLDSCCLCFLKWRQWH